MLEINQWFLKGIVSVQKTQILAIIYESVLLSFPFPLNGFNAN